MKIYAEDRLVPYKTTKIDPLTTKAEIDGLLARWGIRKVMWNWNLEIDEVTLVFELPPEFGMKQSIKLEPPRIWTKGNRNRQEEINWQVSMRVLFWFLKTNLENAYLMQFDKTTTFLPFILGFDGQTKLKDIIIPRLERVSELQALPGKDSVITEEKLRKVIEANR
jgi:hypothetical protein